MAFESYLKAEGSISKAIPGESPKDGRGEWIPIIQVDHQITATVDPNTGSTVGHEHHGSIMFTKQWGASSPLWLKGIHQKEKYTLWYECMYHPDEEAHPIVYMEFKFESAMISEIKRFVSSSKDFSGGVDRVEDTLELERIAFSYDTITQIHHPDPNNTCAASWTKVLT
jgi:type VI secretion system Hcp family effector